MTTRSATSRALTIFEGPDGSGKSTTAQEYATLTGALYIHHGPYKQVGDGLARMVLESMLPALLGYQDVVLDRCWLSEPIYADAFRGGNDRVGVGRSRIMDRLALRCGAVLVKCLPPWAHVKATFNSRRDEEYLDDDQQLLAVYGDYQHGLDTSLHEVEFDYTTWLNQSLSLTVSQLRGDVESLRERTPLHQLRVRSSGNWNAPLVIVGEDFGEHKNNDAMYQHPFGSLNGNGCSLWLAEQLHAADISEQSLLWVNADELERVPEFLDWHADKHFIALGDAASSLLNDYPRLNWSAAPHPQYWKRFQSSFGYPLINQIQEALRVAHSR